jgi:LmbE family N-acetylglucosaminyl deacetylase
MMAFRALASMLCWAALTALPLCAQAALDASELQQRLERLGVVGSVLYVAAHPDDENTAALTYFSKGRKLRTAYLALTRGGGGQNLIGPELDDSLAAIRTQELLAARRIDGAEQFFTRAVDFGYSKTTEESLSIWGREAVLADMVWVIRNFRPDIIVTRFLAVGNAGHGHHSASAVLALEAFRAAADPARFPEQLSAVKPWQAKRVFWNTFRFDGSAPKASELSLEIGQYDPLLGKSYAELAAESRSQHRSQGFGAVATRGSVIERFEILAGASADKDLFEGVDLTWHRVKGGAAVPPLLDKARKTFEPAHPEGMLPALLELRKVLQGLSPDPWIDVKRQELEELIRGAAGIWVEAIADRQAAAPGSRLSITATALARGALLRARAVALERVELRPLGEVRARSQVLAPNQPITETFAVELPDLACSQPLWLQNPRAGGLHGAVPREQTGQPEGPSALTALFRLRIEGDLVEYVVPVRFRYRDPVLGERIQPFVVTPRVMVNLAEPVVVFGSSAAREVGLEVVAGADQVSGRLRFQVPEGWKTEPAELPFRLEKAGEDLKVAVRITPPPRTQSGELKVLVETPGRVEPARGRIRLDHPHIPLQTLFPPVSGTLTRVELQHNGRRIGYVMGAGDEIPRCLRLLGYDVELLSDEDLEKKELSSYDAIVVGIRAFNTRPRLARLKDRLLDYVAKGGTEVVLYTVAGGGFLAQGPVTDSIGPYPLHLSRDRVTDETAPLRFLDPDHDLLNWPNRITAADFEGWVQERGLYFADRWDARYTPIFATQDPGEKASEGSLLVARHGKGHFIYTGLSFFRQLPEGVPGAYRLFANLLALGKRHD